MIFEIQRTFRAGHFFDRFGPPSAAPRYMQKPDIAPDLDSPRNFDPAIDITEDATELHGRMTMSYWQISSRTHD